MELDPSAVPHLATQKRIVIPDGTLEAMKWLALVLMTLDHINKYLFDQKLPGVFETGRIAMPLFAFVLAYNLARPDALARGIYERTMKRLLISGLLATPFFIGLGKLAGGWWPLNILFMLLVATGMIYLIQRHEPLSVVGALVLFLVGGALVEFWWFALLFFLAAWWYCKSPSSFSLSLLVFSAGLLYLVNQNFWAVGAVPLFLAAPYFNLNTVRLRYAFYAFYPGHLAVLVLIGYLVWI